MIEKKILAEVFPFWKDLTEAQQELVAARNRGECLMQAGTRSLKLKVQIPEKRLAQLGDGRGQ